MRRSTSPLLIGLIAAPLMLVSSAALAGTAADCGNVELLATGTCEAEFSGGCAADCTPLNFVAACDGQCTAKADVTCTGTCGASCETECNVNPGSFDCEASCSSSCKASCDGACSDSGCIAQCEASCDNRCSIRCEAVPPSATCQAKCEARCDASCTVEANVDCGFKCSVDLEGGCKVQCEEPKGALFCTDPSGRKQYVSSSNFDGCVDYLTTQGLTVNVEAEATCNAGGCEVSAGVGCSAVPYVGAAGERWGVGAIAGLMMGLGMIVSRRRRRA